MRPVVYLEGIPGLGKTTAAAGLAAHREDVAMVAENNPLPGHDRHLAALNQRAIATWYLQSERRRCSYAVRLAAQATVICDKGYLATLGYVYAVCRLGLEADQLYDEIRTRYLREFRDAVPRGATTVILTGPVELGLGRRGERTGRRPAAVDRRVVPAATGGVLPRRGA